MSEETATQEEVQEELDPSLEAILNMSDEELEKLLSEDTEDEAEPGEPPATSQPVAQDQAQPEDSSLPSPSPGSTPSSAAEEGPRSDSGDEGRAPDLAEQERLFEQWYQRRRAEEQRQEEQRRQLEEVRRLISEGDYEKLGELYAREFSEAEAKQRLARDILAEYLSKVYTEILSDPVLQELGPEEKQLLDPMRYQSDAQYLLAIGELRARKRLEAKLRQDAERLAEEKVQSLLKRRAGEKLRQPGPSTLPHSSPSEAPTRVSARDLLLEGLLEAYQRSSGEE